MKIKDSFDAVECAIWKRIHPIRRLRERVVLISVFMSHAFSSGGLSDEPGMAQGSPARIKVACIGDSITRGVLLANPARESYPAKLALLLGPAYEVRNLGIGDATMLKKGDFPYWNEPAYQQSLAWGPDVVLIKLGSNDSEPHNWRYKTNFVADYEEFITSYRGLSSQPRILLCTPCPVYESPYRETVANEIAPLVRSIAEGLDLALIDFHHVMSGHSDWFPDNVHPNSRGTTVMAAMAWAAVAGGLPGPSLPSLTIERPAPNRLVLSWAAPWSGSVLQSTTVLRTVNPPWTVVEQPAVLDGSTVRVTNNLSGPLRFYRLWTPASPRAEP
jgi:acyl-CoA thioesterase I